MAGRVRALRRRASVLVSLALLVTIIVTFLTGFIAAALDLNRFVLHKYAAYVAIALASAHVALHWRALIAQVKRWRPGRRGPVARSAADRHPVAGGRFGRRAFLGVPFGLALGLALGRWWAGLTKAPIFAEGDDLGQVYHRWSNPSYVGLLTRAIRIAPQPALYKAYPGATTVALPPPAATSPARGDTTALEATLRARRSVREYAARAVTLDELARVLHGATGITDRRDPTLPFRSVPSSGALYPIEVYPVVFNVAGVAPGVYHYDINGHRLELVRAGDFRQAMFRAAVSQEMVLHTGLVLVLTGLFARVQARYVERAYRYIMLEAGHLGQNVYLTATALGLGPCGIGAFFDDEVNGIIGVDGQGEMAVYLLSVGARRTED